MTENMPKRNTKEETGEDAGSASEAQVHVATLVRPVSNAIRILRYLSQTGAPETVTNTASALDINTSTCFNILRTLAAEGVVSFNERSKSYSIGLGIVQLAQSALTEGGKIEIVRPLLLRVAQDHEVTVTLWRISGSDRNVLISSAQNNSTFQVQMQVGQRVPMYIGAFGRVLAYHHKLGQRELMTHFSALRWGDAPSFADYWADVEAVGVRGWAADIGNFARGVASVAVPIFEDPGGIRHGIVATTFQGQQSNEEIERLALDLVRASKQISGIF